MNKNRDNTGKEIPSSIKDIRVQLSEIFSGCSDFVIREIKPEGCSEGVLIAFLEGLIDKTIVNRDVIAQITSNLCGSDKNLFKAVKEAINTNSVSESNSFDDSVNDILLGNTAIYGENAKAAIIVRARGAPGRSVTEPDTEVTVRGPREGFVENIYINAALLRRKIRNSDFKMEVMQIGKQTRTEVAICYIKGIAPEEVIETVKRRLKRINTDAILESGYIEQFIEDAPYSMLPVVGNSEKPDKVAAKVLEGRVAIICDGTPLVLTVPYLLIEALQAGEDYYEKPYFSSFIRLLRLISIAISVGLPAFYVALVAFHQNIIPFKLLLTMSASREGIPFSPFAEALLMILVFEFLRESGARMPRTIGQTIGIVGAVVIGEATVRAGIASAPMVIVTSITAICSFITPPLTRVMALARIITLIAANITGIFGIVIVFVFFFIHMCSLRSFGVPYLAPISPLNGKDLKDTYVRFPLWSLVTRPRALIWDNENARYRMKVDKRKKED